MITAVERRLCEILNQQAECIDAAFYKEAVQSAMKWGVSNMWFKDYLQRYMDGRMWIFVHQN